MNTAIPISIAPPKGFGQWMTICQLYRSAFPRSERKPFSMIRKMFRAGKTDVWYCTDGGRFIGLAITINGPNHILLDYFAIAPHCRGEGYGSAILQALRTQYKEKGLFGEIESVYDDHPEQAIRLRRKQFYLDNGMTPMEVMVYLFGVKMELIGFDCQLSFDEYKSFYANHYSQWAADHISPAPAPDCWNQ